jgi:small subunit ribosomal protein S3
MGQKIHPTGFRLSVTRNWGSKWFANSKNYAPTLAEDIRIREYLGKKLSHASVAKITIERPAKNARITIHSARPGVVIGKKGEDIETLRADLRKMMGGESDSTSRDPQAGNRRAADRRLDRATAREADHVPPRDEARDGMRCAWAPGHQGHVVGPPERRGKRAPQWYREGRVPLHTLRADIDYGFPKRTTYGVIGIKVWVFKGERMAHNAEPVQTSSRAGRAETSAPPTAARAKNVAAS